MATQPTFLRLPKSTLDDANEAQIVVVGISEASPYKLGVRSHSADAPAAIRAASQQLAGSVRQFDFDLKQTLFPTADDYRGCIDIGDLATHPWDAEGNRARITEAVTAILDKGARPIVLGGDDSVPIPVLAAYEALGSITVLQIDAHVDWADVIQGNPYGYGSPMRRASEYGWVTAMIQIGIRGLGSGESWQHDDARKWGSRLISSYELHNRGIDSALAGIEPGANVFISIDCDGIDPAVFPAVNMPTPGGLTYEDMIRIMRGVAAKSNIVGLALVEYVPAHDDRRSLCALTAARIASICMGLMLDGAGAA